MSIILARIIKFSTCWKHISGAPSTYGGTICVTIIEENNLVFTRYEIRDQVGSREVGPES